MSVRMSKYSDQLFHLTECFLWTASLAVESLKETARTPKTVKTRRSGFVHVLYCKFLVISLNCGLFTSLLLSAQWQPVGVAYPMQYAGLYWPSMWQAYENKTWLPSWQECPVMTHAHMHYKACEMYPILKPAMAQNNADYCQINSQTSFNENSPCCLHTGEPSQSDQWWGGAWDMHTRSWVTCFNSCPNPQLETVSPSPLALD